MSCVIRDEAGKLLIVAGSFCDVSTVEEAKMRAIRLLKLHGSGCGVWLEGDSLTVIQKLKVSDSDVDDSSLLLDAKRMLRSSELFKVSHTYRKGNKGADWTTISGHEREELLLC